MFSCYFPSLLATTLVLYAFLLNSTLARLPLVCCLRQIANASKRRGLPRLPLQRGLAGVGFVHKGCRPISLPVFLKRSTFRFLRSSSCHCHGYLVLRRRQGYLPSYPFHNLRLPFARASHSTLSWLIMTPPFWFPRPLVHMARAGLRRLVAIENTPSKSRLPFTLDLILYYGAFAASRS